MVYNDKRRWFVDNVGCRANVCSSSFNEGEWQRPACDSTHHSSTINTTRQTIYILPETAMDYRLKTIDYIDLSDLSQQFIQWRRVAKTSLWFHSPLTNNRHTIPETTDTTTGCHGL